MISAENRELAIAFLILGLQFGLVVLSFFYWRLGVAYDKAVETIDKLKNQIVSLENSKIAIPITTPLKVITPTALFIDEHEVDCKCQTCSNEDWSLSID